MNAPAAIHLRSHHSLMKACWSPRDIAAALRRGGYGSGILADWASLAGAVEFWQAMRAEGLHPVLGCEFPLRHPAGSGTLLLVAENDDGYRSLCRLLTRAAIGAPPSLEDLHGRTGGLLALTSGKDGLLHRLLLAGGPGGRHAAAARWLHQLGRAFGPERAWVELFLQHPGDSLRCARLADLARETGLPAAAACEARYASPDAAALLAAVASIGTLTMLDEPHPAKPSPASGYHLRSAAAFADLFSAWPEAVAEASGLAARCRFHLGA